MIEPVNKINHKSYLFFSMENSNTENFNFLSSITDLEPEAEMALQAAVFALCHVAQSKEFPVEEPIERCKEAHAALKKVGWQR